MLEPTPNEPPSNRPGATDLYIGKVLLGILQSAFLLLVVGLVMIVLPILDSNNMEKLDPPAREVRSLIHNLSTNTGVAFIAASMTIILVDSRSRKQNQQELRELLNTIESKVDNKIFELGNAEQNSIILSLVSDKAIFQEIQNHLLRKDFILRNYKVEIQLDWSNNQREFLVETNIISYDIENTSSVTKYYDLRHLISNEEQYNATAPEILQYNINGIDSLKDDLKKSIEKQLEEKMPTIQIEDKLSIERNSSLRIEIVSRVNRRASYEEPWVLSRIADGFELYVSSYPKEIKLSCVPLHPLTILPQEEQEKYYSKPKSDGYSKDLRWSIKTGILPYQGLLIFWRKEVTKN